MTHLERLHQRIVPLKTALLDHPVYRSIDCLESLHIFMQHHVFAVWDFMSLLKSLQRSLTCVDFPWVPVSNDLGCRFINEIVLAEESDHDGEGFVSHFEMYRRAMVQCGASTASIDAFIDALRSGISVDAALKSAQVDASVRGFVQSTFATIRSGTICGIASAFTFGREDLLPGLFQRIVDELSIDAAGGLCLFRHYLHRHINLDGGEHGPMAGRIMESLCGSDDRRWSEAERAAVTALEARRQLWDGIYENVRKRRLQIGVPIPK